MLHVPLQELFLPANSPQLLKVTTRHNKDIAGLTLGHMPLFIHGTVHAWLGPGGSWRIDLTWRKVPGWQ